MSPLDLSAYGFHFVQHLSKKGSRGNPAFLDLYAGPVAERPSPTGKGSDSVSINAAYVQGLSGDVAADVRNLLVPRGADVDDMKVEIDGRPALLVHDGVARYVVVAQADWRIQVSTDAPPEALSNERLLEITAKAEVR